MRVPQTFIPEKSLDYKIKELSESHKTKEPSEDLFLYEKISHDLRIHLELLDRYPVRIFWISDRHKTSRYKHVEKIINEIIEGSDKIFDYKIFDYFNKKFKKKYIYTILEAYFESPIPIVYMKHKTTQKLKEDYRNALLLDLSLIMLV